MKTCIACESTNLVHSGIDAFMLGVPTETVCYSCAQVYATILQMQEAK
jgi:hypothetical protein